MPSCRPPISDTLNHVLRSDRKTPPGTRRQRRCLQRLGSRLFYAQQVQPALDFSLARRSGPLSSSWSLVLVSAVVCWSYFCRCRCCHHPAAAAVAATECDGVSGCSLKLSVWLHSRYVRAKESRRSRKINEIIRCGIDGTPQQPGGRVRKGLGQCEESNKPESEQSQPIQTSYY